MANHHFTHKVFVQHVVFFGKNMDFFSLNTYINPYLTPEAGRVMPNGSVSPGN
jgi:hypothetical protein